MSTVVALNVPAGDGVGTSVDVSTLGSAKTFVINGVVTPGEIFVVEASVDPTITAENARTYNGVISFNSDSPGKVTLDNVANRYRVRRLNSAPGLPNLSCSAELGVQDFAQLNVPLITAAAGGTVIGTSTDISAFGDQTSVCIGGTFLPNEQIVLEGSLDNVSWDGILSVNNGYPGVQKYRASYNFLRVVRTGPPSSNVITVVIGTSAEGGGGGGFPGYGAVLQDWVNLKNGTGLTVARADHQHTDFPSPDSFVVYCVDYDGIVLAGNDTTAQPGYALSTGVPATDMATALTAAKLTPFKTLERVGQLLPRHGNNATVVVLVRPRTAGATYRNIANTADQDGNWRNGLIGWKRILAPRGTNDFVNDANDKIICGFQTVPGIVAGVAQAGTNLTTLVGPALSFPAEALGVSTITLKRVRITGGARLNATSLVVKNTTNTITLGDDIVGLVPGDPYVIEEPAVRVANLSCYSMGSGIVNTDPGRDSMVGVRGTTGTTAISAKSMSFCGVEVNAINVREFLTLDIQRTYGDETGATIALGMSLRADTTALFQNGLSVFWNSGGGLSPTTRHSIINVSRVPAGTGGASVMRCGLVYQRGTGAGFRVTTAAIDQPAVNIGNFSVASQRLMRVCTNGGADGAVVITGSQGAACNGIDFSNQAGPLITIRGATHSQIDNIASTDGGNTDVVLDVSRAYDGQVIVGLLAAITATATLGDTRLGSGILGASFTNLVLTNFPDTQGNNIIGTAGVVCANPVVLTAPGALSAFTVVRQNGVDNQMVAAIASTTANASGVMGILITSPGAGAPGLVITSGPCGIGLVAPPTLGPPCTVWLSNVAIGFGVTAAAPAIALVLGTLEKSAPATSFATINLVASPQLVTTTSTSRSISIPFVWDGTMAVEGIEELYLMPASVDALATLKEFLAAENTTFASLSALVDVPAGGEISLFICKNGVDTTIGGNGIGPLAAGILNDNDALTLIKDADSWGLHLVRVAGLAITVGVRAIVLLTNYV